MATWRMAIPLTAEWLIKTYLTGLDLTDDDGNWYPPEIFQNAIDSALSWVEAQLGIRINPATVTERIDGSGSSLSHFPPILLPDAHVTDVNSVKWRLGNATDMYIEWPGTWQLVRENQIQMIPVGSADTTMMMNIPLFAMMTNMMGNSIPGLWEVNYTAGWQTSGELKTLSKTVATSASIWKPDVAVWGGLTITLPAAASVARTFTVYGYRLADGKPFDGVGRLNNDYPCETVTIPVGGTVGVTLNDWSQITMVTWTGWTASPAANVTFSGQYNDPSGIDVDAVLLDVVGKVASIAILNTAGDLIIGAGIANKSTAVDGISASVGTTSSPTNAGYGARIIQLRKEIDQIMKQLWLRYNGIQVAAW